MIGEGRGAASRTGPFVAERRGADARRGRRRSSLEAKEGLALINGTQYMASLGALALLEAERLCVVADVAGAMSLEALKGSSRPFDERLQAARPHPGQAVVRAQPARAPRRERDHGEPQGLRQGAGRLLPALHAAGARRDARRARWVRAVLEREVNASPTTRASSSTTTAAPTSSAAATSTASRSRSRSISRRWRSPSSRTSASGASSSSSTRRSRRA